MNDQVHLLQSLRDTETFVYVASPYSKYPGGMEAAFHEVCRAAAWLVKQGVKVFCPIAHTHPIAVAGNMDLADHEIWMPQDGPFMDAASCMVIVEMESFDTSYGIQQEHNAFIAAGKRVYHLPWPKLPEDFYAI